MSNAHDDRDHDRPFHRSLQQKSRYALREVVARGIEVGGAGIAQRGFYALADDEARLVHEVLVVAQVDEAAGDDVGGFVKAAGAAIHGGHDHTKSFLTERLAIAHKHVAKLGDRMAFDHAKLIRCLELVLTDLFAVPNLDDRAVVGDADILGLYAYLHRYVGMHT